MMRPLPFHVPVHAAPALAATLMLSATAFIAATTLLAKALGTEALGAPLHPLQISHGRFVFAFLGLAAVAALRPPRRTRIHWRLHLARTSLGWLGVSCMFAAVAFIPLGDATAISFLNPVFAMLLAIPLLGERVGPWRWAAAAIAFIGALVLLRPGTGAVQLGALLALAAAVIMGLEVILIKRLSGREPAFQILLVNNVIGMGIASLAVVAVWAPPTLAQWGALVGLGLVMACAQGCFLNAMARAEASFVVPFSYATLVFATLYDFAVFQVRPDVVSVLGAATILSGAALLAWREGRQRPGAGPAARPKSGTAAGKVSGKP